MELGMEDRVAIVTAASRGLGRATAEALAAEGVRTVVVARSRDELEALAASLPARSIAVTGDLTDPTLPARLVEVALHEFGRLDILVANNGGPPRGGALEVSDEQLLTSFEGNLLVPVRLVREAIAPMRAAGWGRICIIASGSVKQPMADLALSNTTRPGLWGWAKTAAGEVAGDGITVNLVCPGHHATARTQQIGRMTNGPTGDPKDFGKVVAFLCSTHARFVTGTAVLVDGGNVRGL
jgi:3-oxoacyl-[acyl-carrier protein] reductase